MEILKQVTFFNTFKGLSDKKVLIYKQVVLLREIVLWWTEIALNIDLNCRFSNSFLALKNLSTFKNGFAPRNLSLDIDESLVVLAPFSFL